MINENFIRVYEHAFTPEHCKELIDIFKKNMYDYSQNNNWNDNWRQDKQLFIQDIERGQEYIRKFYDSLNEPLRNYCKEFPILESTNVASYTVKLQETKPSQGYHVWHFENSIFDVRDRVLVWTVYLNDIDEGGETEFIYQSERYKPKQGSVLIFPAGFTHTHRGNPPLKETKYIATGWYSLNPVS